MTSRARLLSRDIAVYGFGEIAVKAFAIITIPVYTRLFTPDEYGIVGYVGTVAGLLAAVLILGGDSAYARFFFATSADGARRTLTTTWLGFLAAWATIAVLALIPLAPRLSEWSFGSGDLAPLFVVAFLAAPVALLNRMFGQVLRNQFRATGYTALNILSVSLTVALSIVAVVAFQLGPLGVFVGALAAELIVLPVRLWSARTMLGGGFSRPVLGDLLRFGLPLVPTSIAYWVFLTSDRLVLAQLSSLEQLGFYAVAVGLVAVPSVALAAIGQAWTPHVIEAYETDRDEAQRLVVRVARYVVAGFGALAVGVTAFAPEAIRILSTPAYLPAAAAVAPLALGMVAQATTSITALGITMAKRTSYLALGAWVAAIVNLGLNLALDGTFGMAGAAWATMIAYTFLTVIYHVISRRLWAIPFPPRPFLIGLLLVAVFTLGAGLLPEMPLLMAILVKGAVCLAYAGAILLLRVVPREDLGALYRVVAGARRR